MDFSVVLRVVISRRLDNCLCNLCEQSFRFPENDMYLNWGTVYYLSLYLFIFGAAPFGSPSESFTSLNPWATLFAIISFFAAFLSLDFVAFSFLSSASRRASSSLLVGGVASMKSASLETKSSMRGPEE